MRTDNIFGIDCTKKITKIIKAKDTKENRDYWKDMKNRQKKSKIY
jgi:hypothetical protein